MQGVLMPRAQEASTQTCGSILVRLGTHLGYDIICIMRPRSAGARSPGFEPRAKSAIAAVWFPSGHPITRRTLLAALERQTADRIDPLRRCRRQVQSLVTPHLMVCWHRARGFAVTLRGLQLSHALQEGFAAKRNLIVDLGEGLERRSCKHRVTRLAVWFIRQEANQGFETEVRGAGLLSVLSSKPSSYGTQHSRGVETDGNASVEPLSEITPEAHQILAADGYRAQGIEQVLRAMLFHERAAGPVSAGST
jgi:hypothetical protein